MKFLSLILTVILVPQMALASNVEGFKAAIDQYNYALEVVWDQKDTEFVKQQDEVLQKEISNLLENGLTKNDIVQAFPMIDAQKLEMELLSSDFSNIESVKNFIKLRKNNYLKGASWSGEVVMIGVGVLAGVALVMLFISAHNKREKIRQDCLDTYVGADPGAACAYRAGPMQLFPWNVEAY